MAQANGGGDVLEYRLSGAERLAVGLCGPTCILEIGHILEQAADGDRLPAIAIEAVTIAHRRHHELGGTLARNNFEIATTGGLTHGLQEAAIPPAARCAPCIKNASEGDIGSGRTAPVP